MKRFRAFVESNSSPDNKLHSVVDIKHDCVIASDLSWVSATFICDALNEKQARAEATQLFHSLGVNDAVDRGD